MSNLFRNAAIAVGAIVILACGGGGGGGVSGSQTPEQLTQGGLDQVNRLLADQDPVTVATLSSANQKFSQARNQAPQLRGANAGYCITAVALEAQRMIDLLGISINRSPGELSRFQSRINHARFGLMAVLTPEFTREDAIPIPSVAQFSALKAGSAHVMKPNSVLDYPEDPTYQEVYTRLVQTDAVLQNVVNVLQNEDRLPSDAEPLELTDPRDPLKKVKLGLVEMRTLRTAVIALRSAIALVLAYDLGFDPAVYAYNGVFRQVHAGKLDGRAITPNEYLPGGNFGNLHADGRARIANFRTFLVQAIDSSLTATAAYRLRSGTGWAINPGDVTAEDLTEFESRANEVRGYATQPTVIDIQGFSTTLDVVAFVADPPASLKALLPPIRVQAGEFSMQAMYQGTELPDRSFGGLFTPSLPSEQFGSSVFVPLDVSVSRLLSDLLRG